MVMVMTQPQVPEQRPTVVLVAFYNIKALGVRYLETAFTKAGYRVVTVFFKQFNSVHPAPATEKELELMCDVVRREKPVLVGLSVMSSMYLDSVHALIEALQRSDLGPIVCGGAYASLAPEHFLDRGIPFVTRLDGEVPLVQLAEALRAGRDWHDTPSLCYREGDKNVINPIGGMTNDVDSYGIPTIQCSNACLIDKDTVVPGDPQLSLLSYEVIASRGCPFTCSYCSCVNLHRLYPEGIKGVRTRSVKSIIEELKEAKRLCKKMVFVHFYDEIFPNLPGWVDEFVEEYHKHIDLPFTIWTHPKMTDPVVLKKLRKVGLTEVIMGIQTGSTHIRQDIFHRYETNEDVVEATRRIHESGVFWATYDFMLQHPFETLEDLKDSYRLAKELKGSYELQLHGLNFLPGTDIVPMAIEAGHYTAEEMDKVMYAPMDQQFKVFWKQPNSRESQLWYDLIYLWQFPRYRSRCLEYEKDPIQHESEILKDYEKAQKLYRLRYLYKKSMVVLKSIRQRIF